MAKTVTVTTSLDPSRPIKVSPEERDELDRLGILKKDAVEKTSTPITKEATK